MREKFQTAEQLWFWFLYSRSVRNGFMHTPTFRRRPCELIDVETLITKLYLSGRLNDTQLAVMAKYGERRRAPNPHTPTEFYDDKLWRAAMQTIADAAVRIGWIEPKGGMS